MTLISRLFDFSISLKKYCFDHTHIQLMLLNLRCIRERLLFLKNDNMIYISLHQRISYDNRLDC